MTSKRIVDYQIHIQGCQSIKGSLKTNPNQTLVLLRDKIQKQQGFPKNTLIIQQPQGVYLNQYIKIIILHEIKQKQKRLRKQSQESSIVFEQQSIIQKNISQQFMYRQPQMPPKVIGKVKKCYKIFSCMSSNRQMILNYQSLKFYNGQQTINNLQTIIQLNNIKQVSSYRKKQYYFIKILTKNNSNNSNNIERIDIKFLNKDICKQWINYFNQALDYSSYLEQKMNYYKKDSYKDFIKSLEQKQKDKTKIIKLQDSTFVPTSLSQSLQKFGGIGGSTGKGSGKGTGTGRGQIKQGNTIINSSSGIGGSIRLSDFKITHQIGKGAFSTVYKAQYKNKIYALKQINKDKLIYQNQIKYAISQLNILKKSIKCPFIIPLYCSFQTQDYLYIAIKYLPFGTLKHIIQKRQRLTIRQSLNIIYQLIIAIQFLHDNKILYRDMKPQNILMTKQGHIYLIDFGLSIELDQKQQFAQSFVGTPLYLAPQRLDGSGKINFKADIYGIGCILYLMLHGHAPYQAQSLASIIYNIKNSQLNIRSDIDDLIQDFLKKTLESNVQKRLSHMSSHPLFQKVDWKKVSKKENIIMNLQVKEGFDYCGIVGAGDHDYTQENFPNKKVNDWNYIGPEML